MNYTLMDRKLEKKRRNKRDEEDNDTIKEPAVFILEFEHVSPSYQWHRHLAVVKCALGMVRTEIFSVQMQLLWMAVLLWTLKRILFSWKRRAKKLISGWVCLDALSSFGFPSIYIYIDFRALQPEYFIHLCCYSWHSQINKMNNNRKNVLFMHCIHLVSLANRILKIVQILTHCQSPFKWTFERWIDYFVVFFLALFLFEGLGFRFSLICEMESIYLDFATRMFDVRCVLFITGKLKGNNALGDSWKDFFFFLFLFLKM